METAPSRASPSSRAFLSRLRRQSRVSAAATTPKRSAAASLGEAPAEPKRPASSTASLAALAASEAAEPTRQRSAGLRPASAAASRAMRRHAPACCSLSGATGLYAYVNIGFLSMFSDGRAPILDLADHCDPSSGGCASLATDVASCQSAGIKLLLSIGGGTLGGYNLSSPSDAQGVAAYLWDNFLGGNGTGTGAPRPLGDAVLDGIDFHIEATSRYYNDLARNLTSLYRGDARSRKYMLTAALVPGRGASGRC